MQNVVRDKSATIVVYCMDQKCNASPRAAERLDKLGYSAVYDNAAGNVDWRDAGLPIEP